MWEKVRYVVARRNKRGGGVRYYWVRPGCRTQRLSDDPIERMREARKLNDAADRGEASRPARARDRSPHVAPGCIADAIRRFQAPGGPMARLAPSTRTVYRTYLKGFERLVGDCPLSDLTRPACVELLSRWQKPAARKMARKVLHVLLSQEVNAGRLPSNPLDGYRDAPGNGPRRRVASADERAALAAAAEGARHADGVAMMLLLLTYTGQRPGDCRALRFSDVHTVEGAPWLDFVQQKTRKRVRIPLHPKLAEAIAVARARAELAGVAMLDRTIAARADGRPFTQEVWRKAWNDLVEAAGCPDLQSRDLRRTAVVMLAEAGCTVPQIAAITGHSINETQQIVDTYFVATDQMAADAMGRLVDYERRGRGRGKGGA